MIRLILFLQQMVPDIPDVINYFGKGTLKPLFIPRNTPYLIQGAKANTVCFIEKGLIRIYYYNGIKDVTMMFLAAEDIILARESFLNQVPSKFYIEALEDCQLLCMNYRDFAYALEKIPVVETLKGKLIERYQALYDARVIIRAGASPAEKCRLFREYFPALPGRLTLEQIASYLDISVRNVSNELLGLPGKRKNK